MSKAPSRRDFVRSATFAGAAAAVGDLGLGLPPVSAAAARWDPELVRFDEGIEPLVQLLETTPRARVLEVFAECTDNGTSYREVLTALHLAGIRNIPPRPDVGWKFHAVLVLHSAHLASLAAPESDRWLPIFFALDFFKSQQAFDERESEWSMGAVDEAALPAAAESRSAFMRAMQAWNDDAADAAAASLVRNAERREVFEQLAYFGMRDFRNIGHKPIYVANAWRTLEFVGWQNAEPMVRSLVYALLNHHDQPNPARNELQADAPWRRNQERVETIREGWSEGALSSEATSELLSTLRAGTWDEASGNVVELLNGGASPDAILDGLFSGAAELLVRQPSIVSLHGMTATNALMYLYRGSGDDRTRRLLLLQNAAFLVQFREELKGMGPLADDRIDTLEPAHLEHTGVDGLAEVFELIGEDGRAASGKALAYLRSGEQRPEEFIRAARRSSMLRCRNGHDYKFSSAIAEDYGHISPAWRDRYLAASVHYLRGSGAPDNPLVQQTRALLET